MNCNEILSCTLRLNSTAVKSQVYPEPKNAILLGNGFFVLFCFVPVGVLVKDLKLKPFCISVKPYVQQLVLRGVDTETQRRRNAKVGLDCSGQEAVRGREEPGSRAFQRGWACCHLGFLISTSRTSALCSWEYFMIAAQGK